MQNRFDVSLMDSYKSSSQIARVLTESWVLDNMYCPRCGSLKINHFPNNKPVADFFCPSCGCEYELKSKNGALGNKITDGAYDTMIERIKSNQNPDFFFLSYSKIDWKVNDLIVVPKIFFVPEIIEKRKPLAVTARRAGWVGCNILFDKIPKQGRISIIRKGVSVDISIVVKQVNRGLELKVENIKERSWLFDILNCVNQINKVEFELKDIYEFESILSIKHPDNHNVKPKIRQQLQVLRDRGFVNFLGNGKYRKI